VMRNLGRSTCVESFVVTIQFQISRQEKLRNFKDY
jgi:hypothetical protein